MRQAWPVLRLWPDLDAQYRQQMGAGTYELLRAAADTLPAREGVLLVTPGTELRSADYVIYHRALYWLAPRPVWWAAPAAGGGDWEARWHLPTELASPALAARAVEVGARCVLAWRVSPSVLPGRIVGQWEAGSLAALDDEGNCTRPAGLAAAPAPPMWASLTRALLSLAAVAALGAGGLFWLRRLGLTASGVERLALSWLAGAALTSAGMLWLGLAGVSLRAQVAALSACAVLAAAWNWVDSRRRRAQGAAVPAARPPATEAPGQTRPVRSGVQAWASAVLAIFVLIQVLWIMAMALGRPLEAWDSWVNWAMKARILFAEDGLTPALYADSTRLIAHPSYPLLVPELQAWTFAWLGAPDDRFAALPIIAFYLAALAGVHAGLRRAGAEALRAWLCVAALACLPGLALWTALAYADAVVAALAALAGAYGLAWVRGRGHGALLAAAVAIGLLPWVKGEGWILAAALALALGALTAYEAGPGWRSQALTAAGVPLAACALLAGPWLTFTLVARMPLAHYADLSLEAYVQQLGRLAIVARHGLGVALEARTGYEWFVVGLALVGAAGLGCFAPGHVRPPGLLGLGVPVLYLVVVTQAYVFSDYAPFERHVMASLERLVLHVAPLPLLWLALLRPSGER